MSVGQMVFDQTAWSHVRERDGQRETHRAEFSTLSWPVLLHSRGSLRQAKQPLPELITQSRFCPLSRGYIDDLAAKIWPHSHFLLKAKNVLTKMPNI